MHIEGRGRVSKSIDKSTSVGHYQNHVCARVSIRMMIQKDHQIPRIVTLVPIVNPNKSDPTLGGNNANCCIQAEVLRSLMSIGGITD